MEFVFSKSAAERVRQGRLTREGECWGGKLISRPGRSQGLLYKHLCASFIHSLIQSWFVKISLWRRHALMVEDGA